MTFVFILIGLVAICEAHYRGTEQGWREGWKARSEYEAERREKK